MVPATADLEIPQLVCQEGNVVCVPLSRPIGVMKTPTRLSFYPALKVRQEPKWKEHADWGKLIPWNHQGIYHKLLSVSSRDKSVQLGDEPVCPKIHFRSLEFLTKLPTPPR